MVVIMDGLNFKKLLSFALIILLLPSCAYQTKKIFLENDVKISYNENKENVDLNIKYIDNSDSKSYFSSFVPLQIQIKNKSNDSYILKADNISLNIATLEQLKKKVPKVILSSFVPTGALLVGAAFWWQVCLPLAAASAVLGGVTGEMQNKSTKRQLDQIAFCAKQEAEIKAHTTFCKLVFIEKDEYCPKFDLKLINTSNKENLGFSPLLTNDSSNFIYRFGL